MALKSEEQKHQCSKYRTKKAMLLQCHCRLLSLVLSALLVFHAMCQSLHGNVKDEPIPSRRKRHVVFPLGSTFSLAFCQKMKMRTSSYFISIGMNWAVAFDLPNHTLRHPTTNRILPPFNVRRRRRELYSRLEVAMDGAEIDGRTCIKRALCEAAQKLKPRSGIVEEIIRLLFTLPLDRVDDYEPIEHHVYDAAHRRGLSNHSCPRLYRSCRFSLIEMALR